MIWTAGFRTAVISSWFEGVEDPEAPDHIHPVLDSGDGMHLNDRGAQARADSVILETLALGVQPGRPSATR